MKAFLFSLLFVISYSSFSQYPTSIVTDTNSYKAYMIDNKYLLDLDLGSGKIKRFRMADSILFQTSRPSFHIYNNQYLLIHAIGGYSDCKTYLLTKKGEASWMFDRNIITDRQGKNLYAVNSFGMYPLDSLSWGYQFDKKVDFENPQEKKGHFFNDVIGDFCIMSADGGRVALLQNKILPSQKEIGTRRVRVFDTKSGKLLCSYEGTEEDSKNEIKFMDFSFDGNFLIMGNSHRVILYDVNKQEKMGSFDEDQKNNRERFSNVAFYPNSAQAIICSRFKIYTVPVSKKFDYAIENVTYGGETTNKIITTYIVDEYNAAKNFETTSTYAGLAEDYYWDNFCFSPDYKYMYGLIRILNDQNKYMPHLNKYLISKPSVHKLYELRYGIQYDN